MMNYQLPIVNSQFTILLGVLLFLLGIAHMSPRLALLDARIFRFMHKSLRRANSVFQVIWHLGRTPLTLVCLVIFLLFDLQIGIMVAIILAAAAIVEWSIKRTFKRPRPYILIPDAIMAQPRKPKDASFPSGDAMRIWFLALTIPFVFGLSPVFIVGSSIIALIVTLGRIAMGVHFPLDTLAGTGLGLIASGVSIYLISSIAWVS
ncbi:MAG: phosphatase PAP2 family protein [Anaerolineales bacterium]|nr:phosphatase PAP2 family protein [Chloroflexota bacterium]MBL6979797.1 phosphatase PAP2 family protein [Anaerolineales bacterium]